MYKASSARFIMEASKHGRTSSIILNNPPTRSEQKKAYIVPKVKHIKVRSTRKTGVRGRSYIKVKHKLLT